MTKQQMQMSGTPKQVAWAEKIIAYKTKGAKTCGIDEKKWEIAIKTITEKYGAKGWIDMRDEHPMMILGNGLDADPSGCPEKKIEESVHDALENARREDIRKQAVKLGLTPEIVLKTDEINRRAYKTKDVRIQLAVQSILRDAADAAKRGDDKTAMILIGQAEEKLEEGA